ncbi:MAG: hypothetical protein AB8B99_13665 [Phormidesmis sp.]
MIKWVLVIQLRVDAFALSGSRWLLFCSGCRRPLQLTKVTDVIEGMGFGKAIAREHCRHCGSGHFAE